jgi:abortive infection bacteriophage resistance protein
MSETKARHPEKPFKTLDELCTLLIDERGLSCIDQGELKRYLARTNYYRFSGYMRQFQQDPRHGDNSFEAGVTFEEIRDMVFLDTRLRLLLQEQLGVIEIAIRARFAHECGRVYGSEAFYLDPSFYKPCAGIGHGAQATTAAGILLDLSRDKSGILKRYEDSSVKCNGLESGRIRFAAVPIWVAIETLSFGRVSNMIGRFKDTRAAKQTAAALGVQWAPFSEVIHSLSVLRNLCAHHRQIWNRRMGIMCPVQKKLKPKNVEFEGASVYAHILMMNHYRERIDGDTALADRVQALLDENERFAMGIYAPNPR